MPTWEWKLKKLQREEMPPTHLVSTLVLAVTAILLQMQQGHPSVFSVAFLFVAFTSVIHNSRCDRWWYYDVWRALDYAAICAFTVAWASEAQKTHRGRKSFVLTGTSAVLIVLLIWLEQVPEPCFTHVHSVMHVVVCVSVAVFKLQGQKRG